MELVRVSISQIETTAAVGRYSWPFISRNISEKIFAQEHTRIARADGHVRADSWQHHNVSSGKAVRDGARPVSPLTASSGAVQALRFACFRKASNGAGRCRTSTPNPIHVG